MRAAESALLPPQIPRLMSSCDHQPDFVSAYLALSRLVLLGVRLGSSDNPGVSRGNQASRHLAALDAREACPIVTPIAEAIGA